MATITDKEFGTVTVVRSAKASHIKIRVGTDGQLRASLPLYTPTLLLKRLLHTSRGDIRSMLEEHRHQSVFVGGMQIGKSHTLTTRPAAVSQPSVKRHGQQLIVSLPEGVPVESPQAQAVIRPAVIAALRREAKAYLPKRLAYLAEKHGFSYSKVRFSHASGRWGSCSSQGTISLNIALMKLPFPLIDYVLLHELSHTAELNHSPRFWATVERCDPSYKIHRERIKSETPSI